MRSGGRVIDPSPGLLRKSNIAKPRFLCYNDLVMEKRVHIYVSRKNVLTWLMTLCMICSAVTRIAFSGLKGFGDSLYVWSQIVLPTAAVLLYVFIVLVEGKELFYKTAIPVWMAAVYFAFAIANNYRLGPINNSLYFIALAFLAVLYTQISSGQGQLLWLLPLLTLSPIPFIAYFHRDELLRRDWAAFACSDALPNILMMLGFTVQLFALHLHPSDEYHPTWGDRTDGRRLRTLPPMAQVSPYIMVTRNTSTNYFTEAFEISNIDRYIRMKRREGLTSFGITHVFLAAYCRAIAKYPGLNRFLSGQKVYSRGNDIQFCMTVKKEMSADSPDTVIKVHLTPCDTAKDVYEKMNAEVEKVKNTPLNSSFDHTAHALTLIPGVFLKFVVWLLRTLDYFGLLPKFLLEVSPFHGTVFFTSMGSLGIPPIYHHLYDFGNLPVFGAFGCKRRSLEVQEDGSVVQKKYVDFKFCMDERIADGYYYAAFFKHLKRILQHPEVLDQAPDEVIPDID